MDDRVRLNILGLSFSPVKDGAYFLILSQENGPYRIPIVIGASEAQSIAMVLEGVAPSRPLTHDFFVTFAQSVGATLTDVCIYKYEEGIFFSELSFVRSDGSMGTLDARTSDAIAVAVRTGIPIYTTHAILRETGMIIEENSENNSSTMRQPTPEETERIEASYLAAEEADYASMTETELEERLEEAVADEDYDTAQKINDELTKRKNDIE